jgi:hypothetical protein
MEDERKPTDKIEEENAYLEHDQNLEEVWDEQVDPTQGYVREFSREKEFTYDKSGKFKGGTAPAENIRDYWGINGPSFIFSSFKEENIIRIDDMQLSLDTAHSAYKINHNFFLKKIKEIVDDKSLTEYEIKLKLVEIDKKYDTAYGKITRIYDEFNQNIITYARARRANPNKPGAERSALYTKAIISDRPDKTGEKRTLWNKFTGRGK